MVIVLLVVVVLSGYKIVSSFTEYRKGRKRI